MIYMWGDSSILSSGHSTEPGELCLVWILLNINFARKKQSPQKKKKSNLRGAYHWWNYSLKQVGDVETLTKKYVDVVELVSLFKPF